MQRKLRPTEQAAVDRMQECVQLLMESTTENGAQAIGEYAYWLGIKYRLERMEYHGTSDGHPMQEVETPPIPEGYRKAETDEVGRPDAKVVCPYTREWANTKGETTLNQSDWPYIVPVDVTPSKEDAETGWWVMVRDSALEPWFKRQLISIHPTDSYPFKVLTENRKSSVGYRYARHRRSYE